MWKKLLSPGHFLRPSEMLDLAGRTERCIRQRLTGPLSCEDLEFFDRAASLGLFPMEDGWIAGGFIAKLAVKRFRSSATGSCEKIGPFVRQRGATQARELSGFLRDLDSATPPAALLRLRADLVRRGLIE